MQRVGKITHSNGHLGKTGWIFEVGLCSESVILPEKVKNSTDWPGKLQISPQFCESRIPAQGATLGIREKNLSTKHCQSFSVPVRNTEQVQIFRNFSQYI